MNGRSLTKITDCDGHVRERFVKATPTLQSKKTRRANF